MQKPNNQRKMDLVGDGRELATPRASAASQSIQRTTTGNAAALSDAGNLQVERELASTTPRASDEPPELVPPRIGIIDASGEGDPANAGSNVHERAPTEGSTLTGIVGKLPNLTRVVMSGRSPRDPGWSYVSASTDGHGSISGYVQTKRLNFELPEPSATVHEVVAGETAESLAAKYYKGFVRPGRDLRFYENVLLHVNQKHRVPHVQSGIRGTAQDPNVLSLLGHGANNIQLVAGGYLWIVSPAFANTLHDEVGSGTVTENAYNSASRAQHGLRDVLASLDISWADLEGVAAEQAAAMWSQRYKIVGIASAFLLGEMASAFFFGTGAGAPIGALIDVLLAACGGAFVIGGLVDATHHGKQWLSLAFAAQGDPAKIKEARAEFIRMGVVVALSLLQAAQVKAKVASSRGNFAAAKALASGTAAGSDTATAAGPPTAAPNPRGPAPATTSAASGTGPASAGGAAAATQTPAGVGAPSVNELPVITDLATVRCFERFEQGSDLGVGGIQPGDSFYADMMYGSSKISLHQRSIFKGMLGIRAAAVIRFNQSANGVWSVEIGEIASSTEDTHIEMLIDRMNKSGFETHIVESQIVPSQLPRGAAAPVADLTRLRDKIEIFDGGQVALDLGVIKSGDSFQAVLGPQRTIVLLRAPEIRNGGHRILDEIVTKSPGKGASSAGNIRFTLGEDGRWTAEVGGLSSQTENAENAESLAKALRDNGIPVTLVTAGRLSGFEK